MEQTENNKRIDELTRQLVGGKMAPPPKVTERKVPTIYRSRIKFEYFRQFPWHERIKILFGYNLVLLAGIATQHSPGQFQPLVVGTTTRDRNATDHMQRIVQEMLEDQQKAKAPVEHEEKK